MNIGFIGGGNMASAIISGLQKNGFNMKNITVFEPSEEKRAALATAFHVDTFDNVETSNVIDKLNVIVFAIKPQQLQSICHALNALQPQQLIISIAAGIRAVDIARWLNGHKAIIRVMPNTPAQIQAGISGMFALSTVSAQHKEAANTIMQAVGKTLWLENESEMDALTAISGSGPAYVFYLIEALEEAAIKLGFNHEHARLLALETFHGASQLAVQSDADANTLRSQVTSKGGTTEQGIAVLESADIKSIIYQAAKAAADKSVILGDALAK
jgi:pyrroline-5-carboxylate reductase